MGISSKVSNLSVVLITIRSVPHFDWFFEGLGKQTVKPFEVIVVDDRWSLERYTECQRQARTWGVNLGWYGKSKPSRWTGKRPALCNARNTAVIVANTPHVIFHDDNGIAHPKWVERHSTWAAYRLMGAGTWYTYQHGTVKDGQMVGETGPYGWEARRKLGNSLMAAPSDWLHGGNMGFPVETALAINGFDEDYDGEQGCDDCDFGIRARRAGYKPVFDPECIVYYSLDSHALTQNEVPQDKPDKALLPRMSMAREPKKKVLLDDKEHFSNEWLTQALNLGMRPTRANPQFNLESLREEYRRTMNMDKFPLGPERDWRDNQPIGEME